MALALVTVADVIVGIYLLWYGLRRKQRDRPGVLIVGGILVACAVSLGVIFAQTQAEPDPRSPATPPPAGTPV